jgi:hypothetical protein
MSFGLAYPSEECSAEQKRGNQQPCRLPLSFLRTLACIPCSNHLFAIRIGQLKITEPEYTHLPTQLLVAPIPISIAAAATSRPAATTTTSTPLVTAATTAAAELLLAPVTCLIDNDRPVPQGRTV